MNYSKLKNFYEGKKVFITGATGFKGSWLSLMLNMMGAEVYGYALKPETNPALCDIVQLDKSVDITIGDIRDIKSLEAAYIKAKPDVVLHLAAQPIVRDS